MTASPPPAAPPAPARADLERAWSVLRGGAPRAPFVTCAALDARAGASLVLKCENLQRVGAFKFRGAYYALSQLDDASKRRGVVTHSSGNHGQALALAARLHDAPVTVVVPEGAPKAKVEAIRGYGATIVRCAPTTEDREATAARVAGETGGTLIPPFDHADVIAGQSTVVREMLEQAPDLEIVVAPVGGGGLLSGAALAAHHFAAESGAGRLAIWGAEPRGAPHDDGSSSDDAAQSLEAGRLITTRPVCTVADGLRTRLAPRTFAIVRHHVERIVSVEEDAIVEAMRLVWERAKLVIEPSAAVPVAAVLHPDIVASRALAGRRVGIVLTGGNVDLDRLPWQEQEP